MKRKRYTEEQIISMLKQHEAGRTMVDLAHEYSTAENTLYCCSPVRCSLNSN